MDDYDSEKVTVDSSDSNELIDHNEMVYVKIRSKSIF